MVFYHLVICLQYEPWHISGGIFHGNPKTWFKIGKMEL
jgi:hypothetical protein